MNTFFRSVFQFRLFGFIIHLPLNLCLPNIINIILNILHVTSTVGIVVGGHNKIPWRRCRLICCPLLSLQNLLIAYGYPTLISGLIRCQLHRLKCIGRLNTIQIPLTFIQFFHGYIIIWWCWFFEDAWLGVFLKIYILFGLVECCDGLNLLSLKIKTRPQSILIFTVWLLVEFLLIIIGTHFINIILLGFWIKLIIIILLWELCWWFQRVDIFRWISKTSEFASTLNNMLILLVSRGKWITWQIGIVVLRIIALSFNIVAIDSLYLFLILDLDVIPCLFTTLISKLFLRKPALKSKDIIRWPWSWPYISLVCVFGLHYCARSCLLINGLVSFVVDLTVNLGHLSLLILIQILFVIALLLHLNISFIKTLTIFCDISVLSLLLWRGFFFFEDWSHWLSQTIFLTGHILFEIVKTHLILLMKAVIVAFQVGLIVMCLGMFTSKLFLEYWSGWMIKKSLLILSADSCVLFTPLLVSSTLTFKIRFNFQSMKTWWLVGIRTLIVDNHSFLQNYTSWLFMGILVDQIDPSLLAYWTIWLRWFRIIKIRQSLIIQMVSILFLKWYTRIRLSSFIVIFCNLILLQYHICMIVPAFDWFCGGLNDALSDELPWIFIRFKSYLIILSIFHIIRIS